MDRLFRTQKSKIIALCTVILLAASFFGWNWFLKEKFQKLKTLDQERAVQVERSKIMNRIAENERKIAGYQKYFSKTDDSTWLIDFVNRTAGDTGLPLISVLPQEATQDIDAYKKIALRLETRCGYHELGEFLSRIESSATFIKITFVSLKPADPGSPSGGLDVSIFLHTLSLKGSV